MTCYEVLTGRVPFQDHPLCEQSPLLSDLVINQHLRPKVPEYVDNWARELLQWCWQSNPAARPSFEEILSFIEANSGVEYIKDKAAKRVVAIEEGIQANKVAPHLRALPGHKYQL
ncbi:hypothetical protein KC19_12G095900 [Ceratodon purpureus]|uniref:Protein kinase domain-containing protein n=1 Tax=Ceratodon purpureus TaxID=3225 RepID=A0A8T0G820_CERPU|nr:hypothetical protein KC19_12G095900 [Ceratodon purpureus]